MVLVPNTSACQFLVLRNICQYDWTWNTRLIIVQSIVLPFHTMNIEDVDYWLYIQTVALVESCSWQSICKLHCGGGLRFNRICRLCSGVASQLDESVGQTVGYRVAMDGQAIWEVASCYPWSRSAVSGFRSWTFVAFRSSEGNVHGSLSISNLRIKTSES